MCADPARRLLLVQESFSNLVTTLDALDGQPINQFALCGIKQPTDIAVDPSTCSLYATDYEMHAVRRYDYSGIHTSILGIQLQSFSCINFLSFYILLLCFFRHFLFHCIHS